MTVSMIIAAVLIGIGFLFMLISLIGIVKLPDFFTRLHAQGIGDTLGAFLILAGMMAAVGANLLAAKIFLIFIIIVLTNPLGTNLMMIAAINKEDYLGYSTLMSGEDKTSDEEKQEKIEKKTEKTDTKVDLEGRNGPTGMNDDPEDNWAERQKENLRRSGGDKKKVAAKNRGSSKDTKEAYNSSQDRRSQDNRSEDTRSKDNSSKDKKKEKTTGNKPDKTKKKSGPDAKSEKKQKPENKQKAENQRNAENKQKTENRQKTENKQKTENIQNDKKKVKSSNNRRKKPSMNMNKAELVSAAEERGIKLPEEATKREILDLIYSSHDKNRR